MDVVHFLQHGRMSVALQWTSWKQVTGLPNQTFGSFLLVMARQPNPWIHLLHFQSCCRGPVIRTTAHLQLMPAHLSLLHSHQVSVNVIKVILLNYVVTIEF